ncbi:hypothetical protein [Rathayibacter rathayi]|uniref:hypothetical protein n=1 Tax=Rathayibacter rathayi TaxID=33887 RepID=UPI000CE898AA|nr:hypothetical protein [Rathayibacter rathayi]PPF20746.1 hypothetical protein C5C34_14135 [Rathayibacter rathayi]PPG91938.1 hypothetical protein C5C22_13525 [Rathayibacter rathayi]
MSSRSACASPSSRRSRRRWRDPPIPAARAVVAHAVALRTALPAVERLSPGERLLLDEWLERIAD